MAIRKMGGAGGHMTQDGGTGNKHSQCYVNAQRKFSAVGQATMTKAVYYLLAEAYLAQ